MLTDATPDAWQKAVMLPFVALLLEGAGKDLKSAWAQAIKLIGGFMPATEPEFRLSVRMAIVNIQSNLAFCWAAQDETTIAQAIRLQQNGMALAKAADQAQARLSQLQAERIERAEDAAARKRAAAAITVDVLFPPKKTEKPKTEASKTEAPKAEAPKTEEPKAEAPKTEEPKTEASKTDTPRTDTPRTDTPKADTPKADTPEAGDLTAEASGTESRKVQTPQPRIDEAKAISKYASVNKMTYPQAWGRWQRAKKAAQALLQSQSA